jgi:Tol biopolymer transport system component
MRALRIAVALSLLGSVAKGQTPADSFPWQPIDANAITGSPDGHFLVFRDPATQVVRLLETATGRAVTLIESVVRWPQFVWSPDSRQLLVSFDSTKFIHSVADGSRRPITVPGSVYGWTRQDELLVRNGPAWYLVGSDGSSGLRELARGVREAVVTPDGRSLLIQQNRRSPLMVRDLTTRAERRLTTLADAAESNATISRDGRLVAFLAGREDGATGLFIAPLDGELPVAPLRLMDLTSLEVRSDILVAWWLDNGSIAVSNTIAGLNSHLYRVDIDPRSGIAGDVPRRITTGNGWDTGPAFSPNGKELAFSRYVNIAILDVASNQVRTIDQRGNVKGWYTPTQVLVDSVSDGRLRIDAIDVAGRNRVTLADLTASSRTYAAWAYLPTTQDVVYFRPDTGAAGGLRRYNLRSRADLQIVAARDVRMILAAPDGRRAVYATGNQNLLVRLDQQADSTRTLSNSACELPVAWAPDARRLLCSDSESLTVLDVDSGLARRLLPRGDAMLTYSMVYNYNNAAWSPDGSSVVLSGQYVAQTVGRQWTGLTPEAVARRLPR